MFNLDLVWRAWYYFRRGHATYLSFMFSFGTFVIVAYELAIKNIPDLIAWFPNMWIFAFTFGLIYVIISTSIGWQDMKRGAYKTESNLCFDKNPRYSELYNMVKEIKEASK